MEKPTKKGVAPPMAWRTRLSILAAGCLTDATCRADGTINRRLLNFLDPHVPPSAAPRNGVASRDVVVDPAIPLRARLFYPCRDEAAARRGVLPRRRVRVPVRGVAGLRRRVPTHRQVRRRGRAVRRLPPLAGAPLPDTLRRRASPGLRFLDDPNNHPLAADDGDVPPLDVTRCFVAGDSAGANIAHHVARRYALASTTFANLRLAGLIAIQPFFGGEERTPAELRLVGAPIVSVPRTDWLWRAFLPPGADRTHEAAHAASPAGAAGIDSPAFPPATVVIGGYDPLQDWQRRYCETLRGKGKAVRVLDYPDAIHAFYIFPEFAEARDLMLRIKDIVAGGGGEH
ncbi:hypothetical protein OsJ_33487 [Oryza sativa Japonica Group]|uniref:Alpha/beta hydrolase fold-3 domain-containing protein n=1 Tax=Oryza sativa subsp. japonica TaxID=39947 RepID=B9GA42_ORYSJ|nr:hypothetical protein OsJ_33487 [Oryza sativa Japonica Group]